MKVLLFVPRFAPPIRAGTKRGTLRTPNARSPFRAGETISLRTWSGKPYRSRQQEIVPPVVCSCVSDVALGFRGRQPEIYVGNRRLSPAEAEAFVRADGFECAEDFHAYWHAKGVLTWRGNLIEWEVMP